MQKLLLSLFFLLSFACNTANSQTLAPGDIAFLGYNTDANGTQDHSFSWITLEDLSAGTVIYFTEEGWNANGNTWYAGNEGHYSWTATGATPAGTIIYVYENGSTNVLISSVGSMSSLLSGTGWNLSGGDNLFAYQSTTGAKPSSPTFLSGLYGDDNFAHTAGCDDANNWFDCQNCTVVGQSCATTGTATSGLPSTLTNGTNAIVLFPNPFNETDNAKYNGTLTGTKAFVASEINNRNNWVYDDSNAYTITSGAFNTPNIIPPSSTPTITTTVASGIKATTATLGGNVTDNGGVAVTERGIVYNTTGTPTTSDTKVQIGSGDGSFSDEITGLTASTTYYVRAYAINNVGTSYGNQVSFTTLNSFELPTPTVYFNSSTEFSSNFSTGQPSGLASYAASGGIDNTGRFSTGNITAAQIWTFHQPFSPTLANWKIGAFMEGTYISAFGITNKKDPEVDGALGLPANDAVTAYRPHIAIGAGDNNAGSMGFFNTGDLTTLQTGLNFTSRWRYWEMEVSYLGANQYRVTARIFNANSDGTLASSTPLVEQTQTVTNAELAGSAEAYLFIGLGTTNITSIDDFYTSTYVAPSYSPPTLTTLTAASLTATTATLGGNVTNNGGASVTERGVVYNTTGTPTTSDTKVQIGSGDGSFSDEITGLIASTTYYVRAYAINSVGTSYGNQVSFTTDAPSVLLNTNPTISFSNDDGFSDSKAVDGEGGSVNISDIDIEAYPINSSGTALTADPLEYHDHVDWPTYPPIVTYGGTLQHYGWAIKSANGDNFSLESLDFMDWGTWNLTFIIEAFDNGSSKGAITFAGNTDESYVNLSQSGILSAAFSNVDEIRIYKQGGDKTWTALNNIEVNSPVISVLATVTTTAASGITATTATLGGNVTDNGGVSITDRGIVYNTIGTPNIDDDTKVQIGTGDGSFSDEITGLTASTMYYVRAYAINSAGTGYGSQISFTTSSANKSPIVDANTGLTVNEGETAGIDSGKLHFDDEETADDSQLTATITGAVAYGTLFIDDNLNNTFDSGDAELTVGASFTQDDINNDRLRYTSTTDNDSSDSFIFTLSDPDGGTLTDQTFTITIVLVNDAPTFTGLPASVTVTEDATEDPFDISAGTISDVDAGGGELTLKLEATGGVFDYATGTGITLSGQLTSEATFTGNLIDLNNYINTPSNIYFRPDANLSGNGAGSVDVSINDNGNTGSGGGTDILISTISINITAVNDAPSDILLDNNSIPENEPSGTLVGTLSATDVDNGDTFTYTLVSGIGSDDNFAFSIAGNELRSAAVFDFDVQNSYSIRIRVTDAGGLTFEKPFTVTVDEVNESPSDILLDNSSVAENEAIGTTVGTLSAVDPNAGDTFVYTFADGAGDEDNDSFTLTGDELLTGEVFDFETKNTYTIRVRVTDSEGLFLELPFSISITDVNEAPTVVNPIPNQNIDQDEALSFQFAMNTFQDVDGDDLTYSAQLSGGGALPAWLSFNPANRTFSGTPLNTNVGTVSIEVIADDGNGESTNDTFDITVANVNDIPTVSNAIPDQTATENVVFTFQFAANTFEDIDVGDVLTYSAQLSGGGSFPAWLSFDPLTRTFSGTPGNDDTGLITIDVIANDGNGGTVSDSFELSIQGVNDAPVISTPLNISVFEDEPEALTGISFTDPDAGSSPVTVTFNVGSGTLAAISGNGVTVGGTSNSLILEGSLSDINAFIANGELTFTTALNASSDVNLNISITDNGNIGSGGALTDQADVTLTVTAVNDAPVNTVSGTQQIDQDAALVFSSGNGNLISVSDVDAGSNEIQITLTATNGLISLSGTGGLTFSQGSGVNDGTMVFLGTIDNINTALDGLIFSPIAGFNGLASLAMTSNDQGFSGSGGPQTDTDVVSITVNSINPIVTLVTSTAVNGTYNLEDELTVLVEFDQAVTVNTAGGSPILTLETGSTDREASYISGSGSNVLTFGYTVQQGDVSSDLDYTATNALALNGATIQNISGDDALISLPSTGSPNSLLGQKDLQIDGVIPVIASVSVPADQTYVEGETLDFTVNFSELVAVTGNPEISINIGSETEQAIFVSGSGSSALVFSYTVQSGDLDDNGIVVGSLSLNGGTIRDAAGNNANLTLNSVGATDQVLVDAVAPNGYAASFELGAQTIINSSNVETVEFGGLALEIGTILSYEFSSSTSGAPITGTASVTSETQIFDNAGGGFDLTSLGDGTITLTINLTDNAGNVGADATTTVTKDATAPTGYTVAWDELLINAMESSNTSFTISNTEINTTANYSISSSGDGNTATITGSLPINSATQQIPVDVSSLTDGILTIEITLTDDGDNEGSIISANNATLDQTAPASPSMPDLSAASDTGTSSTDNITADQTPTFTGTAEANTSVEVFSEGNSLGTTTADGSGNWSFTSPALTDGTYAITANATDTAGNVSVTSTALSITIDQNECNAQADFILSPTEGCQTPLTVFFTDQSTSADVWAWDFGDGTTSSAQNPIHAYNAYGDFTVKLTVTDTEYGCSSTIEKVFSNDELSAEFNANTTFGCGPLEVDFEDLSVGAESWSWDFGDGTTSTEQHPSHTYTQPGTYSVVLTTDGGSCSKTITKTNYIQVIGPDVDFSTDITEGCGPLTVAFTNNTIASSPSIGWVWDFGDGTTSTQQNPIHEYASAGTYTVKLTVNDLDGCSRTLTKTDLIQVNLLEASIVPTNVTCNGGSDGSITATPDEGLAPFTYQWNNGASTASINGLSAGNYSVIITDTNGCSVTKSVEITEPIPAALTTSTPSLISHSSAELGGELLNGLDCEQETGIVYATTSNPDISDTKVAMTLTTNLFGEAVTGLQFNTTYYVRAYSTNQNGMTTYGNEVTFTTSKKTLEITAAAGQNKIYGDADPVFTFTATGFEGGDDESILTGDLDRVTGEDVGFYAIQQGTLDAGANYSIDFTSADFEVRPATVGGVSFDDTSFTFDGTEKNIEITGTLPAGTSVAYSDNTRTNVGSEEATATITGSNYNTLVLTADLT
ncbi:PKD domain-containing protein, partial [Leeuwenhoekiella marinoflava]